MARRSVPPPKPKSPILTVGQKRRRIERLQKCVTDLEAFDPLKVRKRAPAVIELEAVIDKALSSAFGYGTPAYLGTIRPRHLSPPTLLLQRARFAPSCVQSVDHKEAMRRLTSEPKFLGEQGAVDRPAPESNQRT